MTTYIRANDNGDDQSFDLVENEWDLDLQLVACEQWLRENTKKLAGRTWVTDIGFSDFERDTAAVCGYTVPLSLMKLCVEHHITLWLSSYGNNYENALDKITAKHKQERTNLN